MKISLPYDPAHAGLGFVKRAQDSGLIPTVHAAISGVSVPPPKLTDIDGPADELATHLAKLYRQAVVWSGAEVADRDKYYWMAYALLRKESFAAARAMKGCLRQLRDEKSSQLPMSMYAWWYVNSNWEKRRTIVSPAAIFNPAQILNPRFRRFYWSDCGESLKVQPTLWPAVCDELVYLIKDFEVYDLYCESIDEVRWTWNLSYAWEYKILQRDATQQRALIREKIEKAHARFDIGLYLADQIAHLKIKDLCSTRLK